MFIDCWNANIHTGIFYLLHYLPSVIDRSRCSNCVTEANKQSPSPFTKKEQNCLVGTLGAEQRRRKVLTMFHSLGGSRLLLSTSSNICVFFRWHWHWTRLCCCILSRLARPFVLVLVVFVASEWLFIARCCWLLGGGVACRLLQQDLLKNSHADCMSKAKQACLDLAGASRDQQRFALEGEEITWHSNARKTHQNFFKVKMRFGPTVQI